MADKLALVLDIGGRPQQIQAGDTIGIATGGTGQTTAGPAKDALTVQGTDIASAGTTNLATATGEYVHVTGTTTITALGTAVAGLERVVKFSGILTLTHNATSLLLPGAANITTAANDRAVFRSLGSGNWVCIVYIRSAAPPVSGTNTGDQTSVTGNAGTATQLANSRSIAMTGDVAWTVNFDGSGNVTAAGTLATVPITKGGTGQVTAGPAKDALTIQGADIASASTTNLATATGEYVHVTGTVTITALGTAAAGVERVVKFSGILTLTHNATSLILPGTANITTAANDRAFFRSLGSGNWICTAYVRASAPPVAGTNTGDQTTVTGNAGTATTLQTARLLNGVSFNGSADVLVPTLDNLADNGNFDIWQRGTSFPAAAGHTADRTYFYYSGGMVTTISRQTDVPTLAQSGVLSSYSLKLAVTTADASIGAAEISELLYRIEGYDFRVIAQQTFTVSFWVKAFKTGTYCLAITNSGNDRSYVAEYTVSVSNTWERKTITVSASPTAGTWNYDNGVGLVLCWMQASGSTWQTATTNAWQTGLFLTTTNQVNNTNSTNNTFFLSQLQINPGSTAFTFQPKSYADELAKCQRYFETSYNVGTAPGSAITESDGVFYFDGDSATIVAQSIPIEFKVTKRVVPTMTLYDYAGTAARYTYFARATGVQTHGQVYSAVRAAQQGFGMQSQNVGEGGKGFGWTASADL